MSGQLKEVRSRIQAVTSTQQITKAMKLVAASKLRKAQDKIIQMRPYALKLNDMLSNIVAATEGDVNIEFAKERPIENVLLIVITSDRGLCGGFNNNVLKLVKTQISEKYKTQKAAGKVTVLCVGKKGYEALKKDKDLTVISDHVALLQSLTFDAIAPVAESIMNNFANKKFDVVEVSYNQFKNQIIQVPVLEQFLPITKPATNKNSNHKSDFIFEPDRIKLLEELVPKILKTQFYRFLLDSNASEHGSRMTAMDKATENAEELIKQLKLTYNRVRQAAITTEITEIVGGAAALEG